LKAEVLRQFGPEPLNNPAYGKIITDRHFQRICRLIDPDKTVLGGKSDAETRKIEPTILDNVTWQDAVMGEEIFGPVLPILTFDDLQEVIDTVNHRDKPLALYIFAGDKSIIDTVTSRCAFGGGCVNDVIIHLATSNMGFGGVGESGMGAYHGKIGFDAFTHYKSIVDKKTWLDLPMRYQPYTKLNEKLIRIFLR
jgi:aldehyde dehydrogenase (NAD+)